MRWGFFFVVDELTTRFFLRGTSSVVVGLNTKESIAIRPLRRREFVGSGGGGTGVTDFDSAGMCEWLGVARNRCTRVTDLSDCYSMVPGLVSVEGCP